MTVDGKFNTTIVQNGPWNRDIVIHLDRMKLTWLNTGKTLTKLSTISDTAYCHIAQMLYCADSAKGEL